MEDTDASNPSVETLSQQYETVKTKTTMSPVCQFGDLSFLSEPIGDFEGTCGSEATLTEQLVEKATHFYKKALNSKTKEAHESEMVDSRDHDLHRAYHRVVSEGTTEAYSDLEKEIAHRQFVDKLFATLFGEFTDAPETPQDFDCLRTMVEGVEGSCGRFSAYSLKYVRSLANMCDVQPHMVHETLRQVQNFCTSI